MASKLLPKDSSSSSSTSLSSIFSPAVLRSMRKMSVTQTYYLAHKARAKLAVEAGRSDHKLRLLVGHANFLDSLMLDLADAEREQENWFAQSVRASSVSTACAPTALSASSSSSDSSSSSSALSAPSAPSASSPSSLDLSSSDPDQWMDSVQEDFMSDRSYDSDDSDSEYDEDECGDDDVDMHDLTHSPRQSTPAFVPAELDDDAVVDDMEQNYGELGLVRTPCHIDSPPELEHDADSSDDEICPLSPADDLLALPDHDSHKLTGYQTHDKTQVHGDALPEVDLGDSSFRPFWIPPRSAASVDSGLGLIVEN